jgi:homocysteine S-methyltransferase
MSLRPFLERLTARPLVLDGAMGTMLYERGVFVNTCYDEVCLSHPHLVSEIHRAYVEAGADAIETNTFGANRVKLRPYGLAEKLEEINRTAVRLAREAADGKASVVGSVGPCLSGPGQAVTAARLREVEEAFAEQIGVLAAAGVDAIQLETFSRLDELLLAARVAGRTGLPVVASFATDEHGLTAVGTDAAAMVEALDAEPAVSAIGLNCGSGPAHTFDTLGRVLGRTGKPVVVLPNAGFPQQVQGRQIYVTTPEYFTEYAKRFVKLGARGVGGCCGTTPDHIRDAARALAGLSEVKQQGAVVVAPTKAEKQAPEREPVPRAERSRLARTLCEGGFATSVELLPPKSVDLSGLIKKARLCAEAGVSAINVPDGPRASARVSSMIAALAIEREVGIETVLHYACRDRNLIGMQSDLLGGFAAGLRNILIVTGDPPKLGDYPNATGVFDVDAIGLTHLASRLNRGVDIGGSAVDPPTALYLGVGVDPGALDFKRELDRLRQKVEAGAEFVITQPVFRPEVLFRLLDEAASFLGGVAVIAGVWPLASYRNAEFLNNEVPGVDIPRPILDRMAKAGTGDEARQVGVEIAREMIAELRPRVQGIQVSAPLGLVKLALATLADVLPR